MPYPETTTFPLGLATAPGLSGVIDDTIRHFTAAWRLFKLPKPLRFPPVLEMVYQAETKPARVRELRFTVMAAAGFMCLTTVTDPVLVPDMGWHGLQMRLGATVTFALAAVLIGRLSPPVREHVLSLAGFVALIAIVAVSAFSRAPLSPYGFFIGIMAIIYANTTFPLRFHYALMYNPCYLATLALVMHFDPIVSPGLTAALMFMGVVGSSYSLLANYRMERSARLGYLLASKEALRLFALSRDHDALATISNTDALTGIANRGHFDRRLAMLTDEGADRDTAISLILLDVDFFKRFNDFYGHPAGDACLRSIAQALALVVRGRQDLAFRYGGEEFGALVFGLTPAQTGAIAERVRRSVEDAAIGHCNRGDGLAVVTVSIGLAMIGEHDTPASLIERADQALYQAKTSGRNLVCS